MHISGRIFEILKDRGISQKEFSKMTGIAESTICDWKRKGFNPSAGKIPIICKALDISPDELMDDGIHGDNKSAQYDFVSGDDEKAILELYRGLDDEYKERIFAYVSKLSKDSKSDVITDALSDYKNAFTQDRLSEKKHLCRRLRRLARLERIKLDETEHSSKINRHLFKYLDFLGVDKLEYIRKYLCHIQPFMITETRQQEKFDNAICVLDEYYRVSIYIKLDATVGEELIVSFHENNKNGIAKRNPIKRANEEVYVFPENISSHIIGTERYNIDLFITRGATSLPINIAARKFDEEGFLVRLADISRALVETANNYLQDLYSAELDYSEIEPFYSLQQLSFTSYGKDAFSSISLLIDSLLIQMSAQSRQIADTALCIYCSTIKLPDESRQDLIEALSERFKVNSVRMLPQILERVELNLQ